MSNEQHDNSIDSGEHVREQLSDYIDGLMPGDVRERVRAHLETCAACRADYAELRATQQLMKSMPAIATPRAFTLTPEMAGKARKTNFWESLFVRHNAPRLATGSLVAFLLLFLFVGADILHITNQPVASNAAVSGPPAVANAPAPQSKLDVAAPTSTVAAAVAAQPSGGSEAQDHTALPAAPAQVPTEAIPPSVFSSNSANSAQGSAGSSGGTQEATPDDSARVTADGNASPTTTTLETNPFAFDTTSSPSPAATPSSDDTGWIALQIALLALALGLGAAAFIAWRRT